MDIHGEELVKLLFSFIAGAAIGAEREYRSKSAGLRTMILISLGATIFTLISMRIGVDPSRIAANIVTGIGFIGGGIIYKEEDRVVGITTAATVWVTAALGMSIGSGYFDLTLFAFVLLVISLVSMLPLQTFIKNKNQIRNYRIVASYHPKMLKRYDRLFTEYGMNVKRGKQTRAGELISGNWVLQGSDLEHEKLTKFLLSDPSIIELDF